jgi:glycosyltransferase involved in cell wall biosynthesis
MNGAARLLAADRPVDVVFLTDDLGGGTGNHLLSMIRHWDKETWRARIVSKTPADDRVAAEVPVEPMAVPQRLNRYPIAQVKALAGLFTAFNGRRPDLVHTYFFWPVVYGRILKRLGRIGILIENREDMGFNWGGHEYALLRATSSLPDRVICVCDAVRRVVLDRERLDEERVVVIRNGVEQAPDGAGCDGAARNELGLGPADLVVGMVANYNRPVKGVSHLLDAIPAIVSEVPSVRFLFLGGGAREAPVLRDKARALGIERFVTFTGYRKDVHRFYQVMDISVLTSLSEGLSVTLLESMSHGLPVVATNVGGNPEVVIDGGTGYLVPPKDSDFLADRIVRLLRDPGLRVRMGEEGRRRVERHFRIRDTANRYLDLYKGVIPR